MLRGIKIKNKISIINLLGWERNDPKTHLAQIKIFYELCLMTCIIRNQNNFIDAEKIIDNYIAQNLNKWLNYV